MYLIMLASQHTDTALALSEPNLDTSPSTRTLGDQTKYSGSRVKEVQTLAHCTVHIAQLHRTAPRVRHACQHVSHVSWCGEGVSPVNVSPATVGGGDWLLDCCHGSGPAGAAAARAGRRRIDSPQSPGHHATTTTTSQARDGWAARSSFLRWQA